VAEDSAVEDGVARGRHGGGYHSGGVVAGEWSGRGYHGGEMAWRKEGETGEWLRGGIVWRGDDVEEDGGVVKWRGGGNGVAGNSEAGNGVG